MAHRLTSYWGCCQSLRHPRLGADVTIRHCLAEEDSSSPCSAISRLPEGFISTGEKAGSNVDVLSLYDRLISSRLIMKLRLSEKMSTDDSRSDSPRQKTPLFHYGLITRQWNRGKLDKCLLSVENSARILTVSRLISKGDSVKTFVAYKDS